ncbi:MAG TPA: 3',5'-cyclic-nucleotide phosphodiesterase [Gammaproteobacteria bacterium]
MRLRVLGCSGGIAALEKTTSLLLDDDLLIDAGTGVGDLTLDELARIRTVFLTHSHLDHVACLPLLLDSVFDQLDAPVTVHGLPETLRALRQHIFNDVIWPDFARLPDPEHPVLRYVELEPGSPVTVGNRTLTSIWVNHAVPALGYRVEAPAGSFAFSGDTTTNDNLWRALNAGPALSMLIVECAFSDEDAELSIASRHYCPKLLADDLRKLQQTTKIYLTHPKPGDEDTIFSQCQGHLAGYQLHRLCAGDRFEL